MRKSLWFLLSVLLAMVGFVVAGPYLAIAEIKTGIVEQDSKRLYGSIDFPLVRQSLKEQLKVAAMKSATTEVEGNPLAALVAGLATTLVDGMVDSFVTPAGLASFMEGHKPSRPGPGQAGEVNSTESDDLLQYARYSYDSISEFSVWVPTDDGDEIRFALQRSGLSWKLVSLILPIGDST